jgi:16S rRNA G966 N2-methylase RsmD
MGLKLNRKKKRHYLLSFIYRFDKLVLLKDKFKLKLYLDLEWIFNRLSHEYSFKVYSSKKHPNRIFSGDFILKTITPSDKVLDLGCKQGDIANIISSKAKSVVGIDYDQKEINIAKETYSETENLNFIYSEAYEYLEQTKEIFDVLILSHILEHIDNPKEFLNKFSSFFKKIYIEVPDFDASYLNHYRLNLGNHLVYSDTDHVYEFDREELKELLNSCDLIIDIKEYKYGVQKIWCSHKS